MTQRSESIVTLELDAETWYGLTNALRDFLAGTDAAHDQPCQCVACETARQVLGQLEAVSRR